MTAASLTVSSPDGGRTFLGQIDEVKLRGEVEPLSWDIDPGLLIVGWKKRIHFDRRGRLDPGRHDEPVRIIVLDLAEIPDATSAGARYRDTFDEWKERQRGEPDRGGELTERDEDERLAEEWMKDPDVRRRDLMVDWLGDVGAVEP